MGRGAGGDAKTGLRRPGAQQVGNPVYAYRPLRTRPLHARKPPAYHGALARFEPLYDADDVRLADLSPGEDDSVFRRTATAWFGLDRFGLAVGGGGAAHNGTQ